MPTLRRLLGCGLAALALAGAQAAEVHSIGAGLFITGPIGEGDYDRLAAAVRREGKRPLLLNSPGGRVSEALRMAEYIQREGLATHLPANARCASACVLLFAGGVVRTAHPTSRLGIHMGSGLLNDKAVAAMRGIYERHGAAGTAYIGSVAEQRAAAMTLRQVDFLLSAGVSLGLLKASVEVDHLDVRWLTRAEAREFNLINAE